MKILKILILLVAIGLGAYILLWLFGLLAGILWYAFWIALIVIGGTVGYRLFLAGDDQDQAKLNEKRPTAISEMQNADRTLEEYRKKYSSEDS